MPETDSENKAKNKEVGVKENKDRALEIVSKVVRKNVNGKLPRGANIDDKQVSSRWGGFYDHGPDNISNYYYGSKVHYDIYRSRRNYPTLINKQLLGFRQSDVDPNNQIMTIHFFQDNKAPDSRGAQTPAHVQAEMPKGVADKLKLELEKNPDLLEDIYQNLYPGLDEVDNKPGMRRIKSSGFYILTPETKHPNNIKLLKLYEFKNGPYGTGDRLEYN